MIGRCLVNGALLVTWVIASGGAYAQEAGVVCRKTTEVAETDFRDRSTAQLRWNIEDNKRYHVDPANQRMQQGEYSRTVMADINWTLARYPNHQLALEQLIRYALAGGKIYEYPVPECYFQWAKEFAPDDDKVLLAEGYYHWRNNRLDAAVQSYQESVAINPASSTAHYNLGLIYFERKQYQEALGHAAKAYELGYPLPALRDKLATAGFKLPEAEAPSAQQPQDAQVR